MTETHPILIVDDDEDLREVMALAVGSLGYEVETARDGAEAMQHLNEGPRPALILLDMMMPEMDGEAVLSAVRHDDNFADIPVVLISGHIGASQKADELHANGCLTKPLELDTLARTVERFARH
jgi:CheY-like chemotaxis protein